MQNNITVTIKTPAIDEVKPFASESDADWYVEEFIAKNCYDEYAEMTADWMDFGKCSSEDGTYSFKINY